MKVSLSWLNDYVNIVMPPLELADALTMVGLEIESVSEYYRYLDTVFVGQIVEISPHPNADKLHLCKVETGQGKISVVCGAPNASVGMLSPIALPGTEFPEGFILEQSVIRGQTSEGMLCSEGELGLGDDRSGIMNLDPSLSVGDHLATALGLSDTVFEIEITPNRPDCLSVIGVAREIAAIQKTRLTYPDCEINDPDDRIFQLTSIQIEAPEHCPRYAARLLEDIQIKPSPFWLQQRLLSVGLRPINNIVDVTNFVLMETGQPLHAFDFDRLAQNRIVVRTASKGETFITLDQKERVLDDEMLMICDGEKPVAIGGVMGGLNSEIEDDTTCVLLESAYFNSVSVRRTSKQLGLGTDAAYRFERGVDPGGTIAAANRAAKLMAEVSGGKIIGGLIDEYPLRQSAKSLNLSTQKTNRLLGTRLQRRQIASLLKSIEFTVEQKSTEKKGDTLVVTPPSFRVDISRPEDLMEEVARLFGYNNIPTTFPQIPATGRLSTKEIHLRNRARRLMNGFGFREAINYSFAHRRSGDHLQLDAADPRRQFVNILNPLTEDHAAMRTSLVPGLLQTMHYNFAQQIKNLQIFEIGKVFIGKDPHQLPQETEMLAALWTGARYDASWHGQDTPCDFYDIKGVVERFLNALHIDDVQFSRLPENECRYTRPGFSAQILSKQNRLGLVGPVHPQVLANFDLQQAAFLFELNVDMLIPLLKETTASRSIPKFPAIFRDITIIVDKTLEAQKIISTALEQPSDLVEDISLLNVFEGTPIAQGKKSVSLRVTYRSMQKTLEDEDVTPIHQSIADRLVKSFNASLPA
ncbi:MAG: phenylalanine--tRNA ligase subunit beta [Desulfobacterales bacterium]|jgi:phenylalanyl-tRNA synthetase beta chain